jgi:hypothetical protein
LSEWFIKVPSLDVAGDVVESALKIRGDEVPVTLRLDDIEEDPFIDSWISCESDVAGVWVIAETSSIFVFSHVAVKSMKESIPTPFVTLSVGRD